MNIEKRKIKDQRQKDNTKELRELQNQLQEDADRELEKYTKALKDQYEKMNSANSVDDYDNEISELELKKQKLLSSIKLQQIIDNLIYNGCFTDTSGTGKNDVATYSGMRNFFQCFIIGNSFVAFEKCRGYCTSFPPRVEACKDF